MSIPIIRSSPARWIASHLLRYKFFLFGFMLLSIATNTLYASISIFTGTAFNIVLKGEAVRNDLLMIALTLLVVIAFQGCCDLGARFAAEVLGKRLARDAREELYVSLAGQEPDLP